MNDYNALRQEFINIKRVKNPKIRKNLSRLLKKATASGEQEWIEEIHEHIIIEQIVELKAVHEALSVQYREGMWCAEDNAGDTLAEMGINRQSSVAELLFYQLATDIDTIVAAQAEADYVK